MTNKNDFSDITITRGKVAETIEKATSKKKQQGTASREEQQERKETLRTQGRKGCKLSRINLAFTPDNHQFIKIMAKATGKTMTEVTNNIIAAYRKEHPEFLEKATDFIELLNNENWIKGD